MNYTIVQEFQDLADKWRLLVEVEGSGLFVLKFADYPSVEELEEAILRAIASIAPPRVVQETPPDEG